jgi:hypothetical protein
MVDHPLRERSNDNPCPALSRYYRFKIKCFECNLNRAVHTYGIKVTNYGAGPLHISSP